MNSEYQKDYGREGDIPFVEGVRKRLLQLIDDRLLAGSGGNPLTPSATTCVSRTTAWPRYSRRVEMDEIKKNDFNLNISRYISTAVGEAEIDLKATHAELKVIEKAIQTAAKKHNAFLKELGLPALPSP